MLAVDIAHIIIIATALAFGGLYYYVFGRQDLIIPAVYQALRWAAAGFIIGVAGDFYLTAEALSVKVAWVIVSIIGLTILEHEILRGEEMA